MNASRILRPSFKRTFRASNALWFAIVGGALLTVVSYLAHVNKDWVVDDEYHIVFSLSFNSLLLFLVLIYNFAIIKGHLKIGSKYLLAIVGSLAIACLFSLFSGWMHQLIYDDSRLSDPDSVNLTRDFVIATFAILISIIMYNFATRHQIGIEKEQLQTENIMVRYEALEKQIDPHFLFNSLNTLSGLIGSDDEHAQQYLRQLASTYRYIMQRKRLVPLREELEFVDSYCQMMQIRYGGNLIIEKDIDNSYLHYDVIPISIQLLVENAIKHNVVSVRHPLTIKMETTPQGTFRVSNSIQPKQEQSEGSGLGLANLAKRYKLLCRREVSISDRQNTFVVELPLLGPNEVDESFKN